MGVAVHRTMRTAAVVQPALGAPLCAEQPLFLNESEASWQRLRSQHLELFTPHTCHGPGAAKVVLYIGRGRYESVRMKRQQLFGSTLTLAARQGGEHRRRRGRRQPLTSGARAAIGPFVRSFCLPCSCAFAGGLLQGWKRLGKFGSEGGAGSLTL
jgi:hypothetical protein